VNEFLFERTRRKWIAWLRCFMDFCDLTKKTK